MHAGWDLEHDFVGESLGRGSGSMTPETPGNEPEVEDLHPNHDESDVEPRLLVPNGERVAVFFFPLESGFGFPPGEPIPALRPLLPDLTRALRDLTGDEAIGSDNQNLITVASLVCHHAPIDVGAVTRLTSTLQAFERGFPHAGTPRASEIPTVHTEIVVVEVVVPLITLLAVRAVDLGIIESVLPDLSQPAEELVTYAFDAAIEHVRDLQRGFAGLTRTPTKLLSRQQLPPLIVYGVRNADPFDPGETTGGFFLSHGRLEVFEPPLVLPPEARVEIISAAWQSPHALPFLDVYNQADVALHLDGNLREAAVMIATASEILLNRLILTMRWEEAMTPEESARNWPESLKSRVNRELPSRVGGNWSLEHGNGAPRRWYRDVCGLRNRVAHGGYEPTLHECLTSQQTLNELITWIGDQLQVDQRLRHFPRTASMLFRARLQARIDRLPWLQALWDDPTEVEWSRTSTAWIEAHGRLVRDVDQPRSPDPARAELASVWARNHDEPSGWILTHLETGLASEVRIDPAVVNLPNDRTFTTLIPLGRSSLMLYPRSSGDVVSLGPWVEQYHLNPMLPVMVDHSDLNRPWPLSAPTR